MTHLPSRCGSPQSNRLLCLIHENVRLFPVEDPHVEETIKCLIIETSVIQHLIFLRHPQCVHPQGIVIVQFWHHILLPASLFSSIPADLTSTNNSMTHPFGHLNKTLDCDQYPYSQLISHLIQSGIIHSQLNTTMQVPTIVNASDLPPIIVCLKGDAQVGSRTDGRHSRFW